MVNYSTPLRTGNHIFVFTDCKNNWFQKKLMMQNANIQISALPIRNLVPPPATPHSLQIHPTSILHPPYIHPTSTPTLTSHRPHIDPTLTPHLPRFSSHSDLTLASLAFCPAWPFWPFGLFGSRYRLLICKEPQGNPLSGIKAWVPVLRWLQHSVLTNSFIVLKRFDEIGPKIAYTLNTTWRSYFSNLLS